MIEVSFERPLKKTGASWIKKAALAALKSEKAGSRDLSIFITDNRGIRKINKQYLNHDYATDVISFWQDEKGLVPAERKFLGELVVSAQMAQQMAKELKISFKEELARYCIHGTLHLLGYDDKAPREKTRMFKRQELILKKVLDKK